MRCLCCNKNLNDFESTRKYSDGTYVDMCNKCYTPAAADFQEEDDVAPIMEDNDDHSDDLFDNDPSDLDYHDDH